MMNLVTSLSTLSLSYDLPLGGLLVASLGVAAAIGVVTQVRALLAAASSRPALRPAHSA